MGADDIVQFVCICTSRAVGILVTLHGGVTSAPIKFPDNFLKKRVNNAKIKIKYLNILSKA